MIMPLIPPGLIFLLGAALIPLFKGRLKKAYLLLVPAIALVEIFSMKPQVGWELQWLNMNLVLLNADKLSLFVAYVFAIIGFLAILYSLHVDEDTQHIAAFMYVGSSLGVVFAGDFFTVLFFWEIMGITSLMLVWCQREKESRAAAYRYILFHVFGGGLLLGGIAALYAATGSLAVGPITESGLPYILIMLGIGVNTVFIPLHTWLPDTYPRATITGAVFMSVYTTKTGVYLLARAYPGVEFVAIMGGIMALYGVTFALMQNDARKLLSYHIVSQVGYMVAGIGLGTALAINGGIAHLFNHILYKALLFMTVGSVMYSTGIRNITEMGGLARKMPITTIAFSIAALSISGFPGFNGFVSKGMVIEASHSMPIVWVLLELASIGTFLSFLKLGYYGFFRKNDQMKAVEVPYHMRIAMLTTASLCVLLGLYPVVMFNVLPFDASYVPFELLRVGESTVLFMITGIAFITLLKVFKPHRHITYDIDTVYRAAGRSFLWFINNPLARGAQWTVDVFLNIKDGLIWVGKNPIGVIYLLLTTVYLRIAALMRSEHEEVYKKTIERMWKSYPGEPVRREPIGDAVILVLVFVVVYGVYYLLLR